MKINSIKLAGLVSAALVVPTLAATPAMASKDAVYSRAESKSNSVQKKISDLKNKKSMRSVSGTLDRLLAWNEEMQLANALDHTPTSGVAGDQQGPHRNSRAFAIVSIAVFDAVNSFDRRYESYSNVAAAPRGASMDAAIAQAAFTTLSTLHPRQAVRMTQVFSSDISRIRATPAAIAAGRAVGLAAANAILANRVGDNSVHAEPAFGAGGIVGSAGATNVRGDGVNSGNRAAPNWTPDPVGTPRGVALGARWGNVRPFVLTSGNQFRIPAYPADGSAREVAAYNDVVREGGDDANVPGNTNSAQNQFIGNFWGYDGAPLLGTPPRLYNQLVNTVAQRAGLTNVAEYARLLALVNTTMGDSGVAAWDSKWFHNYWRPVTGVPAQEAANANWKPFGASVVNAAVAEAFTPPFPAYPSGHATFGAATAQSLISVFGNNVRFTFVSDEYNGTGVDPKGDPRPLVPVRYRNIRETQIENGRSRINNGVHWEPDDTEGQRLGVNIVNFTLANEFRRVR